MINARDLTVVLTLKDRSSFTYRWMRWMEEQGFPYKILIADGGSDKEIERHLGNRSNYRNLDYEYIRYPYDSNFDMYVRKLVDAAERVTTRFVTSADNDDLILLEPLERNLDVLRGRDDIHTLGPLHYRFRIHKHTKSVDDLVCADNSRVTLARSRPQRNPTLEETDPLRRLLEVVEKFNTEWVFYGIHRSEDYKRCYRGLQEMKAQRSIFYEWYALYSYAIAGKILLGCTEPFLMRQEDTSQGAGSSYLLENHSNVFLLPDWSAQLNGMIDSLYQWCADMGCQLDRATFEERFRVAFRIHMLNWMEFRGLADRFRRFPNLYALGRKLYTLYRGYRGHGAVAISRGELRNNQPLRRALRFVKEYRHAQS